MKISTEYNSAALQVGEERAIELIAEAGFDCFDLSLFSMARVNWETGTIVETGHPLTTGEYAAFCQRLRRVADACGITCNQSHAPFPIRIPAVLDLQKRAIECTAILGGRICVVHPDNDRTAEENAEIYRDLLPFAKSCGVRIATENMFNWDRTRDEALPAACSHHDDFLRHVELVNDPYLVACVDVGHGQMRGLGTSTEQLIRTLGSHVQALHIHDNDTHRDRHQLPFSMDIDYGPITRALHDVGYTGEYTLECESYIGKAAKAKGARLDEAETLAHLRVMAAAARRFGAMCEAE